MVSESRIQTKIISEMNLLCHPSLLEPFTINQAAARVSGEDRFHTGRTGLNQIVQITRRTATRWYKFWLDFGCLPCESNHKYKRIGTDTLWSPVVDKRLKKIVDACPVFYLDEISDILKMEFMRNFSCKEISKRLRFTLKYSRKIIYEKASQQIALEQNNFIRAMRVHLRNPAMAIFIDESNKDRKAARRKYGWSPIGARVNYRALFNMDTRYTFIGAADYYGFMSYLSEVVLHKYKEKDEHAPVDSDRFVEYVRDVLVPVLGNFDRSEPHSKLHIISAK